MGMAPLLFRRNEMKVGERYDCQCCGRVAVITGEYYDSPKEHGYYYEFEGEQGQRWISTQQSSIRFKKIKEKVKNG
jgi:hypothetical protein